MTESPIVRRINEQCRVYLHKPSGTRYRIVHTAGHAHELHPISGQCRYATDEQLSNPEIWERK
ncbi:hypothetical protein DN824_21935 [Stutzerimonas nosocomialis]|nr:hypothetical protein DN824_21935 [Stutzerimonas nosocomialis]